MNIDKDTTKLSCEASPINSYELRKAFESWTSEIMTRYGKLYLNKDLEKAVKENGFFVTLMMDRGMAGLKRHESEKGNLEWSGMDLFYKACCRSLLGSGFNEPKNRSRQPLMIAFIDVEGTRGGKVQTILEGIHFHTLWFVPDELKERFQAWITDPKTLETAWKKFLIKDVKCDRMDSNIELLTSYSSKYGKSDHYHPHMSKTFDVYPKGLAGIDDGSMAGRV